MLRTRTTTVIVAIIGVGLALTALILVNGPRGTTSEAAEAAEAPAYPRGPHGGRLLSEGALQLEVTIYETGVPPQFRIYPFDGQLQPVPPSAVALQVELHRLGGRIDRIAFRSEADYLQGQNVVEEPHSFDVKVSATYRGQSYAWSYAQIEGKVELGAAQRASAGIVLDTVGPRRMVTTIDLPGEVKADATRRAEVAPRVGGVIIAVLKQEGDRVVRGDVLAIIESRELADAKSAYLVAERQVDFATTTLQREEALWQRKISPQRDYLAAQQALDEATLRLRVAGQGLVALGLPPDALPTLRNEPPEAAARLAIRAPRAGTVTVRAASEGETVLPNASLFVVSDLAAVWVEAAVPAADLGVVRQGQEAVVVSTDLAREVPGRISFLGPVIGTASRTAVARIVLPNTGGEWRPGLFVTVRITREATTVPLAVAAEAVQSFRDWQVVFVRHGDWFEARPLTLGRSDGAWVQVLSGLVAGDEYARANSFAVKAEIGKLGATHDH
ncbi:MAG: efflux RND transporter periplasmic adaptor subunit [Gemmatimonadales bacterium]|nr:efflux RND transporter periplasmic adaptor subunit [Gemmatimonadota bacterium]MBP6570720.1 efflux RND transporter periplasmic adaptor subunit [Gemmatimonadales bacterium]